MDVLGERGGQTSGDVDNFLLPIAGGPHAEFAAEVARAIARVNDATIHVRNVIAPDSTEKERHKVADKLDRIGEILEGQVDYDQSLIEDDDVVEALVDRTDEYDLTVIGATRAGLFQQLLFGTIPEQVGERAENTVIMAKRNLGMTTRMKRWFKSRGE